MLALAATITPELTNEDERPKGRSLTSGITGRDRNEHPRPPMVPLASGQAFHRLSRTGSKNDGT